MPIRVRLLIRRSVQDWISLLVILGLVLSPWMTILDAAALMTSTTMNPSGQIATPLAIKLIKDIVMLGIVILAGARWSLLGRVPNEPLLGFVVFFAVLSALTTFLENGMLALAGLRWFLPVLVALLLYGIVSRPLQARIASALVPIFFLNIVLQVYQLFTMRYFGTTDAGFSSRTIGMFYSPAMLSMFYLAFMYYAYHFYEGKFRTLLLGLAVVGCILTRSASALLFCFLFFLAPIYFRIKYRKAVIAIGLASLIIIVAALPTILNRPYFFYSPLIRLNFILDAFKNADWFVSTRFGISSNTALSLAGLSIGAFAGGYNPDSLIGSWVGNLGIVSFALFLLSLFKLLRPHLLHFHFAIAFILFFLSTIVLEAFPINLLFAVNMAYLARHNAMHDL